MRLRLIGYLIIRKEIYNHGSLIESDDFVEELKKRYGK